MLASYQLTTAARIAHQRVEGYRAQAERERSARLAAMLDRAATPARRRAPRAQARRGRARLARTTPARS